MTSIFTINKPKLLDVECFVNEILIMFRDEQTGQTVSCRHGDEAAVKKIMESYTTVSFNGNKYDLPMITAYLNGYDSAELKDFSDKLIQSNEPHWIVCREAGITVPQWDHVDLIDVAPGVMTSLKIYGGRMHCDKMQDLPYPHDSVLTDEQKEVVEKYCGNDLITTEQLYKSLLPQIELRISMSEQYGIDLRSKSDSQIAEAVIKSEAMKSWNKAVTKMPLPAGTKIQYEDPGFIKFLSPQLNALFQRILATEFELSDKGSPVMPEWLSIMTASVGSAKYKLGIGGLHSQETSQFVEAGETVLADFDVASFYPNIILQQGMFPPGVGDCFLEIYQEIVNRRIAAKRSGDKVVADALKITLNGCFGKLGSPYSFLYAPRLLIQVTITGQLALLMLIEKLHAAGIECKSANTDGIVLSYPKQLEFTTFELMHEWMQITGYELERTDYELIAARDVNNYVAMTTDGKIKRKGIFTPAGLMKNPDREIVYEAVANYVATGGDIGDYIRGCTDIRKFLTVRSVKGGAIWGEQYLGKAVRYYHSRVVPKEVYIRYQGTGNRVPMSESCRPMMDMFGFFPDDIDYDYYIGKANDLLLEIGHYG